jgi:hypothetical protein
LTVVVSTYPSSLSLNEAGRDNIGLGSGNGFQVGSETTKGVPGGAYDGGRGRGAGGVGEGDLLILRVVVTTVVSSISSSSSSLIGTANTVRGAFVCILLDGARLLTLVVGEGGTEAGNGIAAGAIEGGRGIGVGGVIATAGAGAAAGGKAILTTISGGREFLCDSDLTDPTGLEGWCVDGAFELCTLIHSQLPWFP